MGNCLVTKLKVSVNNPNLPVIETMQQFTLDAITASGNSSMTDTQKWALNHFFYEIGAIADNTLWSKVKCLLIPMICGDNASTAFTDYVSNTVHAATPGDPDNAFTNHGINTTTSMAIGTTVFTGNSNDLSEVVATMLTGIPESAGNIGCFTVDKNTSDRKKLLVSKSSSGNYFTALDIFNNFSTNATPYAGSNIYDIASFTSAASSGNLKLISSSGNEYLNVEASAEQITARGTGIAYTNNALRFSAAYNVGFAMISEALTEAERDKVMLAVKGLKQAFTTV